MRVVIISSNDYANLGHNWGNALRSVGVDAVDVTTKKHLFKYKSESNLVTKATISTLVNDADHVLLMHSDETFLPLIGNIPYTVAHTGTRYRVRPKENNYLFKSAQNVITDQTEFMRLIPNGKYLVSSVDEYKEPIRKSNNKLILGHFPSVAETKGTPKIIQMLKPFEKFFEIRINTDRVDHEKNMKRINECDVYVELFKHSIGGNPYGCFGVTAIESAMMGKAVLTQDLELNSYIDTYGTHPFYLTNTENDFKNALERILDEGISHESIAQMTAEKHSHKSTGDKLSKILGAKLPKVTIIIGHNNNPSRVDFFKKAKESVYNQNYSGEIELIDVGTDNSIAVNLNKGLARATGEYVKYLSDDDELTYNCVSDCVTALNNGADFIHGNAITLRGSMVSRQCPPIQFHEMTTEQMNKHHSNPIHGGTTMFRLSDLKSIALPNGDIFDTSLDCAEEMDVYYRLWKVGKKLSYVNSDLYIYRRHDGQKSLGKDVDQSERFKRIQAIKDRYR